MTEQRPGEQGYLGVFIPVDASDGDPRTTAGLGAMRGAFFVEEDDADRVPRATLKSTGQMEPDNWRFSDLDQLDAEGRNDRRLEIQLIVDHEGSHAEGTAPFGQVELYDPKNRSTRMIDAAGRVALRTSHEKIMDAEDGRYAVALTMRHVPLSAPVAQPPDDGTTTRTRTGSTPPGVVFLDAGTTSGTGGTVTRNRDSVVVNGVTFFGSAAVKAARNAVAKGGSASDVAAAASAGVRGQTPPTIDTTRERDAQRSQTQAPLPAPNVVPGGSVPIGNPPSGYVHELGSDNIGLLATAFIPSESQITYFEGREGTQIGTLPLRHDVQVAAGNGMIGRFAIVTDDAAEFEEGEGKLVKGLLYCDTSRANIDTDLGGETMQLVPAIRLNSKLPPSAPPPPEDPPPEGEKEEEKEEEEEEEEEGTRGPETGGGTRPRGVPQPGGGAPKPPVGVGPGLSGGKPLVSTPTDGGTVTPRGSGDGSGTGGTATSGTGGGSGGVGTAVDDPQSQARDFDGPGTPCANATAGGLISAGEAGSFAGGGAPGIITGTPGGGLDTYGWPALGRGGDDDRQFSMGGFQLGLPVRGGGGGRGGVVVTPPDDSPGRIPLGLAGGGGTPGGVVVEPGPDDGIPRGRKYPGDKPGRIPLGLGPGQKVTPGRFVFEGPEGGDRGIKRGSGERRDAARRRARAQAAREARDAKQIKDLDDEAWKADDEAVKARERGDADGFRKASRRADAFRRAKDRAEGRQKAKADKRAARKKWKEDRQERADARKQRAKDKKAEKKRKRDEKRERRRRRKKEKDAKKKRDAKPEGQTQGGYIIDTTFPDDPRGTFGVGDFFEGVPEGTEPIEGSGELPDDIRPPRQAETSNAFSSWNVANATLPYMGSDGGAADIEGQVHLLTAAHNAVKQIMMGAFGGPSYLASNMGVVHKNRPGNLPASSRFGSHWTAYPGDDMVIASDQSVVDFHSILEGGGGTLVAEGGAFTFVREHRGAGITDNRPLILLDNARVDNPDLISADQIADVGRRYAVHSDGGNTCSFQRIRRQAGDAVARLWSAGSQDSFTQDDTEEFAYVDDGARDTAGMMVVNAGWAMGAGGSATGTGASGTGGDAVGEIRDGQQLDFYEPLDEGEFHDADTLAKYRMRALGSSAGFRLLLLDTDGDEASSPRVTFGEGGTVIDGDCQINGKLTVTESIDPTDVQLTDQNGAATTIPSAAAGFEFDETLDTRPQWKETNVGGDNARHALAYLSDVTGGGNVQVLEADATLVQSTDGTEETLKSYTFAANDLSAGDQVLVEAWGTFDAAGSENGNAFFRWGGTGADPFGGVEDNAGASWTLRGTISIRGANNQEARGEGSYGSDGVPTLQASKAAYTKDITSSITLYLRGNNSTGTNADAVSVRGWKVTLVPSV